MISRFTRAPPQTGDRSLEAQDGMEKDSTLLGMPVTHIGDVRSVLYRTR